MSTRYRRPHSTESDRSSVALLPRTHAGLSPPTPHKAGAWELFISGYPPARLMDKGMVHGCMDGQADGRCGRENRRFHGRRWSWPGDHHNARHAIIGGKLKRGGVVMRFAATGLSNGSAEHPLHWQELLTTGDRAKHEHPSPLPRKDEEGKEA